MPFDMAVLDGDFVPMNHHTIQPIGAKALRCFDEAGKEIEGYHHIVRGDTGATIRVAPDSYSVVQNEHLIERISTALERSKLDLTDARLGIDYSHDGARMFAQWLLPAHTAFVRPGVEATLRVVLLNSYDGSTAIHGRIGAYNWTCANTSVAGKEFSSFRFTHSGEIDLEPAVAKLAVAGEEHAKQVRRWTAWPAIGVTDREAREVMVALPDATKSQSDALIHAWLKARDEDPLQGGPNLFCLWNVLTAWCKGEKGGESNFASQRWDREKRVAKLVDSKLWASLEA